MGYSASTDAQPQERKLILGEAHPDHGYTLAPHVRKADRIEAQLMFTPSKDMGDLLAWSIESSDQAFTICDEDNVLRGLWGHGSWTPGVSPEGLGFVWLVSDDTLFTKYALTMTREAREVIFPGLDILYPIYGNLVADFNTVHSRWLQRAGFKKSSQAQFHNGHKFNLFLRSA